VAGKSQKKNLTEHPKRNQKIKGNRTVLQRRRAAGDGPSLTSSFLYGELPRRNGTEGCHRAYEYYLLRVLKLARSDRVPGPLLMARERGHDLSPKTRVRQDPTGRPQEGKLVGLRRSESVETNLLGRTSRLHTSFLFRREVLRGEMSQSNVERRSGGHTSSFKNPTTGRLIILEKPPTSRKGALHFDYHLPTRQDRRKRVRFSGRSQYPYFQDQTTQGDQNWVNKPLETSTCS